MLADVVDLLRCPVCGLGLREEDGRRVLRCERGHSHDVARQGYVNLLGGRAAPGGDTADMLDARAAFLRLGHLDALSGALAAAVRGGKDGRVLADAGAGTGHHLARVLAAQPGAVGVAMDVSPYAARRAARAHPRIGAVVCDVWRALPLCDGVVDVLLDVFAPRNGPEFRRVLAPDGRLLVVTPTARHFAEAVDALGLLTVDERKAERLAETLGPCFEEEASELVEASMEVERGHLPLLAAMGPSAWHLAPAELAARAADMPERLSVTVSCRLAIHRPTP